LLGKFVLMSCYFLDSLVYFLECIIPAVFYDYMPHVLRLFKPMKLLAHALTPMKYNSKIISKTYFCCQGLDQFSVYMSPPTSTSPGGNSWPMAGLWGGTTPPAIEDKYNTLPAGSAAIYRSMFVTGTRGASRSPLANRASSLRLEQPPQRLEVSRGQLVIWYRDLDY
jgi:hypothetical protein